METTLPQVVNNFNAYIGETGARLAGVVSAQLPEITPKTATINLAGMAGEVEAPITGQLGSMTTQISGSLLTIDLLKTAAAQGERIFLRGQLEEFDAARGVTTFRSLTVCMNGVLKTLSLGKLGKGESMDSSVTFEVFWLSVYLDGFHMLEIDKFNGKYVVDGVDYLAPVTNGI